MNTQAYPSLPSYTKPVSYNRKCKENKQGDVYTEMRVSEKQCVSIISESKLYFYMKVT